MTVRMRESFESFQEEDEHDPSYRLERRPWPHNGIRIGRRKD